jgi:hypothetical protein
LAIQDSYGVTDTVGEAIWKIFACDRTSMRAELSFQLEVQQVIVDGKEK